MQIHLFGNPAILFIRTRGFASPDYSGFARSENDIQLLKNFYTQFWKMQMFFFESTCAGCREQVYAMSGVIGRDGVPVAG